MIGARLICEEPLAGILSIMGEPLLISSANPTGRPSARHLEDLESYGLSHLPLIGIEPPAEQPTTLKRATVVGMVNSELAVLSPGDTSLTEIKREWERLKLSGEVMLF
jgi:tRNA A37 threonylcarbamoyladenosine synthetase subunit TsaC/SUA5/YrdC